MGKSFVEYRRKEQEDSGHGLANLEKSVAVGENADEYNITAWFTCNTNDPDSKNITNGKVLEEVLGMNL